MRLVCEPNAEAAEVQVRGMRERRDVLVVGDEQSCQHWEPASREHMHELYARYCKSTIQCNVSLIHIHLTRMYCVLRTVHSVAAREQYCTVQYKYNTFIVH